MTPEVAARRVVETPEGVGVAVELADLGTRAAALLIDLTIIVCSSLVGMLVLRVLLAPLLGTGASNALFALLLFFLRCPYFLLFELRWQGQTPGKRLLGLRVVDRRGGALSPTALAARNIMREVEVFLPMALLLSPPPNIGGGVWWLYSALIWAGVFALMPFFNRDRLRVGDMVGGTWVVSTRPAALERDLAKAANVSRAEAGFRFATTQLDAYGIAELQTLEQVLRGPATPTTRKTKKEVCDRIRAKIDYQEPVGPADVDSFLAAYYAALRAHLEQRALFGDRRADKHTAAKASASPMAGASPTADGAGTGAAPSLGKGAPKQTAWDE